MRGSLLGQPHRTLVGFDPATYGAHTARRKGRAKYRNLLIYNRKRQKKIRVLDIQFARISFAAPQHDSGASKEKTTAIAHLRTSSAANVGTDKDSDKRQRRQ